MTFLNEKALKSKNYSEQIVYILAKNIDSRRKFEIKAKIKKCLKEAYFLGHPNSGSCVKNA